MSPVLDPRFGDVEDDASSTKVRSLLSPLGNLLVEISFPKLIWSCTALLILPGLPLGLTRLVASAWVGMVSRKIMSPLRAEIARFANFGKPRMSRGLDEFWSTVLQMVLPPKQDDGLGIISFALQEDGALALFRPERVNVAGQLSRN